MDAKAKGRLRRYLETKFNFKTAVSRIRRISQELAHRSALEAPMGPFIGETRTKLMKLAQKTGNHDFFTVYLHTGLSSEKRGLLKKDDGLSKEFVKQVSRSLESIKILDSSGQMVRPKKLDEVAIASLIENAFTAAQNIMWGFKVLGDQRPDRMECVDGFGWQSLTTKT